MFTKFKDFFNSLKSKLFALFSNSFSLGRFIRILLKIKLIQFVGITAILLPCLIYASLLFGGQVGIEDLEGFQMPVNVGKMQDFTKIVAASEVPDVSIMSQKGDFRQKSVSKDGGGFVEFGDTVKPEGIFIPNPSTK